MARLLGERLKRVAARENREDIDHSGLSVHFVDDPKISDPKSVSTGHSLQGLNIAGAKRIDFEGTDRPVEALSGVGRGPLVIPLSPP
jgi:hypothetical protein